MDRCYEFDNYPDSFRFYGGSDTKASVCIDGQNYMLKFPNIVERDKRNPLNSSYTNNVFSEYIGCKIAKSLGLPVQEVLLGMKSGKPAVACLDFTTPTEVLVEFAKIENRIIDSMDRGRTPILENLNLIFDEGDFRGINGEIAREMYWDIFILDAIIGNFDRHSGNWGYLLNTHTNELSLAPIYDCGSSLYPQLADKAIPDVLNSPAEIQKRIDDFPKAALIVDGEKVGYKDYILNGGDSDCIAALKRIAPRIDLEEIKSIIDDTPIISETRRAFYKKMLEERCVEIILEPYRIICDREKAAAFEEMVDDARSGQKYSTCLEQEKTKNI